MLKVLVEDPLKCLKIRIMIVLLCLKLACLDL